MATLAGRLAYEDLGDGTSGRSYYSLAADSAQQARDYQTVAIALGYTAQLAQDQSTAAAALNHLSTALTHAQHAPTVTPWLSTIQATICADSGEHATATQALDRAKPKTPQSVTQPLSLIDHSGAHLLATTGHVHLQAGDHDAARAALTAALDQLPCTARRSRILTLVDLATAELRAGNLAMLAATPSPPPTCSTAPPTQPAQSVCAPSAPSQPGLLTLRSCAPSTTT